MSWDVNFRLKGVTPLLIHADDVEESDRLMEWRKDPANKNLSVPGDDRSPAWTWQTYLYYDGDHLVWPSHNIMVGLRIAGGQIILKKQKTFKEITQSGMCITSEFCRLLVAGKEVPLAAVKAMASEPFKRQADLAKKFGLQLFMKRAKVGTAKHVRVRARADDWAIEGVLQVAAPEITWEHLQQLFAIAGKGGQGDWRPNGKTPGPYGQYEATLKKAAGKAAA